jgi:hypothetical protein
MIMDVFGNVCEEGWEQRGVSPDQLLKWAAEQQWHSYYCIAGVWRARLVDEPKGRSVAWAVWDDHCYFYKTARLFSDWMQQERICLAKVEREPRETPIEWSTFKEYPGSPQPGN